MDITAIILNKVILSAAFACLISQAMKVPLRLKKGNFKISNLWDVGGMPSAHAAVVTALTAAIYMEEGASVLFGVMFILAIIFMRDALGLRMTVQNQSNILKKMTPEAGFLKELEGHQFFEVLVGIIVGIIVTVMVY